MGGLSTTIAQAQAADARLKPLVHQAIVLAERIRAENTARAKEEARFTRMAATSRAVMTEVRTIFDDLRRAAAKAQRVEKRAQAACERLALLCDVAARQSSLGEAAGVVDAQPASPAPPRTVSIKQKTAPAKQVVGATPRQSVTDDCLTLQESLGQSRTSLAELRTLVRETGDDRSVAAEVDGQPEEDGGAVRPTVRLATQVERLLTLASGTQHGLRRPAQIGFRHGLGRRSSSPSLRFGLLIPLSRGVGAQFLCAGLPSTFVGPVLMNATSVVRSVRILPHSLPASRR